MSNIHSVTPRSRKATVENNKPHAKTKFNRNLKKFLELFLAKKSKFGSVWLLRHQVGQIELPNRSDLAHGPTLPMSGLGHNFILII